MGVIIKNGLVMLHRVYLEEMFSQGRIWKAFEKNI